MTELELQKEKASEAQLNNLSQNVIGMTAWGQFYGLMRGAASIGEGLIPHEVCLSSDGREVKVYKKESGKVVAAWLKPTHEYITMYIAQKNYGMAIASAFGFAGQLKSIKDQKKAKCVTVVPAQVIAAQTRKVAIENAKREQAIQVKQDAAVKASATKIYQTVGIIALIITIIILLFICFAKKVLPVEIKISEYKKVVFAKPQKPGEQGGGGGGGKSQQVPPDVEMYNPYGEGDEEGEKKEGEDGKEGKDGKKEGKEGEGKDGKGKKGEEGKEGEGEGEGEDGEKGKPGKEGKGGKGGKGAGGDTDSLTQEQLEKGAQELLDTLNKANNLPTTPCGGNKKRNDKNQSDDPIERDREEQEAAIARKQIEEILQKASEEGKEHVFKTGSRGTGGKGVAGAPKGDIIPIRMRKPEFLKKIKDFASKEYEKEYYKKGTDWFYTQAYGDILFKDKPKVSKPQKFLYLMVDVSGSMFWGNFDGKSLLEHLIGYLPVIAEDFKGQVWWISDGLITFKDGSPGITLLSDYKDMSPVAQSEYFKKVQGASGAGGGTTFGVELQAIQDLREGRIDPLVKQALGKKLNIVIGKASKHMAAIIMLTDSEIDDAHIKYNWNGTDIIGGLPPSTVVMTDTHGCEYIKNMYPEDFKNKDLRIECYDVTEGGKYKVGR